MLIKRVYEVGSGSRARSAAADEVDLVHRAAARGGDRAVLRHCGLWQAEPRQASRGPPEESERTSCRSDDPLPPKERKRSAAGGE